jgi:DNA-binding ferritin-like protein
MMKVQMSPLNPAVADLRHGRQPVFERAASAALAQFGKSIRSAIAAADETGDAGTADLFTQASTLAAGF